MNQCMSFNNILIIFRTLACKSQKCHGTKRFKHRITIGLCCNSTGSDKRPMLIIGNALKPRCFKNFNSNLYCNYRANANAWMTASIFQEWIMQFDTTLRNEGRRIILLVDNATSHKIPPAVTNIHIHYLPPNMTACIQPLDAGIIKSFKSHYRRFQLQRMVDLADSNLPVELSLHEAIRYSKMAWDNITPNTIFNCWCHTGIQSPVPENVTPHEHMPQDFGNIFQRIEIIFHIPPSDIMTPLEFVCVDDQQMTEKDLSDEELLNIKSDFIEEASPTIPSPKPPSLREARAAGETLLRYFESTSECSSEVEMTTAILRRLCALSFNSTKQTLITDFMR